MTSTTLQVQKIRVYLSSPGDVAEERALARAVLGSLQKESFFADRLLIEEVSWDDPENPVPLDASLDPQQSINRARGKPSDCDVVVVILWSRLGTPMPENYRKPDGSRYLSGTEWEFHDARTAARQNGRPRVLLYRRDTEIHISQKDSQREERLRQADSVDEFFQALESPDGSLPHAYHTYTRPEDFRWRFENHLRQWLFDHLKNAEPSQPEPSGQKPPVTEPATPAPQPAASDARGFSRIDGFNRLVLVIAIAGLVADALGWASFPPSLHGAVVATLLLIVLLSLLREWQALRDRIQTRRLALTTVAPRVGYFRIGPYEDRPEDRKDFKRADRAHEQVLEWLESATVLPLYLSGDSGAGKSSLLNASVLPTLRERGWTVVTARAWQNPEAALGEALSRLHPALAHDGSSLRDRVEAAARQAVGPLLLLLDQFEECLILAPIEVQAGFRAWVSDLAARPIGNLKLLLVLRKEYLNDLEQAGFPSPHSRVNWFDLASFSRRDALAFLQGGLTLDPGDMDRLLTSAMDIDGIPGKVRPITLNVLGHVLETGGAVAGGLDAGLLVRQYIDQVVDQPGVRTHAPPVLDQLITAHGTKRPRAEDELAEAAGLSTTQVRAVLRGLHQAWLARPLDAGRQVWELSHDFVARAVSAYLGRRPLKLGRQALAYAGPALLGGVLAILGVRQGTVMWETRPVIPEMVEIPDGSFCMGSRLPKTQAPAGCPDLPEDDEADQDEKPARRVLVPAFRLGKHEVTAGEYRRFVKAMQAEGKELIWNDDTNTVNALPLDQRDQKDRLPAVNVSFEDARAYAVWLSVATGQPENTPYRLPTEAEWEYAARAQAPTRNDPPRRRWWGDDPGHREACRHANVLDQKGLSVLKRLNYAIDWAAHDCEDAYALSAPVGHFGANVFGLYDMLGNVWEWVADCYHDSYAGARAGSAAWTDGTECAGGRRVIRGGSWGDAPASLRSATRVRSAPDYRLNDLGFRLAQDLK